MSGSSQEINGLPATGRAKFLDTYNLCNSQGTIQVGVRGGALCKTLPHPPAFLFCLSFAHERAEHSLHSLERCTVSYGRPFKASIHLTATTPTPALASS